MDAIDNLLARGVDRIYPDKKKLEALLRSGRKIKLYQGFDPSMPNLHLGNLVGLLKLRQFQQLGHQVIFLIGDFTGMIGDPTDKFASRTRLTRRQVLDNAAAWEKQAGQILDFKGSNRAKIIFNSRWNDRITFRQLIEISANFTVQQMLERDFYQRRLEQNKPIYLHEFLYPIAQAIDCVNLKVDLEIGGSDQTFNMLCGRTLMKAMEGKEKYVLTTKLLVDSRGQKVGKTSGNAFFLNLSAADMYGSVMSFPDDALPLAFELLTELDPNRQPDQPLQAKKILARQIVSLLHSPKVADRVQTDWENVFQNRNLPAKISAITTVRRKGDLASLITEAKLAKSKSDAKRLIRQGAVEVNGRVSNDPFADFSLNKPLTVKVGKHLFAKITHHDSD